MANKTSSLILASASPRRKELLADCGVTFSVVSADVDESPLAGETSAQMVMRLAEKKATAVAAKDPDCWVLGADTVVSLDGSTLGKPANEEEAREMLLRLHGRVHEVHTGVVLVNESKQSTQKVSESTLVSMRRLELSEISAYIKTGEPFDKAGAYGIQGVGSHLIDRIEGSYTNVVGLPTATVVLMMRRVGLM